MRSSATGFIRWTSKTKGQHRCLRKLLKKTSLFSEIMTWTPSHHLHNVQLSKCYLYQSQGALRNPQQVTQRKRIRIFFFFFPAAVETLNEETKLEVQSWFTLRYDISLKNTKGSHQRALPRDGESLQLASQRKPPALAPLSLLISNSLTHCSDVVVQHLSVFVPLIPQSLFKAKLLMSTSFEIHSCCSARTTLVKETHINHLH